MNVICDEYDGKETNKLQEVLGIFEKLYKHTLTTGQLETAVHQLEKLSNDFCALSAEKEDKYVQILNKSYDIRALKQRLSEKYQELSKRIGKWQTHVANPETNMDETRKSNVLLELAQLQEVVDDILQNPAKKTEKTLRLADFSAISKAINATRSFSLINDQEKTTRKIEALDTSADQETNNVLAIFLTLITDKESSPDVDRSKEDFAIQNSLAKGSWTKN